MIIISHKEKKRMKSLKRFLSLALCIITVGCFSSCLNGNDSSSSSSSSDSSAATAKKLTEEEWETTFDFLCATNNITLDMSCCRMDNNLNPMYSFKHLTKIADGDKYYVHSYENLEYTNDGVKKGETQEEYVGKIDGVDYYYTKERSTGKWQRTEYPLGMTYLLDTTGIEIWVDAYDEMTYNEETGVYRLENKVVKTDDTIPYKMYYMEVEFRDGRIYRIEHEADVVKGDTVGMDVVWKLDGRSRTISLYYDYGTTEITLPEIE